MRISTSTIYSRGASNIMTQQQKVLQLQNQMSSGSRIQSGADDPVAMAQINFLNQKISRECARHGAKLGGESPLQAELRRSVSLGKGVHREVESEGS